MKTSSQSMAASTRALLAGIIDYAGLFPPARLPLEQSLQNYEQYKNGPESWIVSRFVCPVGILQEVPSDYRLSIIGQGGETVDEWHRSTFGDLEKAANANVDTFEVRPPDAAFEEGYLPAILVDLAPRVGDFDLFIEVPPSADLAAAIGSLAESGFAKAKLRTGGLTPQTFPTIPQVALFISECAKRGVPFKATAGMHQPLRHYDADIGVHMHGFVNVILAAALAVTLRLEPTVIEEVLAAEDPAAFKLDDTSASWHDSFVSVEDIARSRELAISFGSCSVDEPLDGLRQAGYLR